MNVGHGQQLLRCSLVEKRSDVKLRRIVGRSPRACFPAVHPYIVGIEHSVEAQYHPLPLPGMRYAERSLVIACQRSGGIVTGLTETVSLPTAWHGNAPPAAVHRRNAIVGSNALHHFQVPHAIQALPHRDIGDRPHTTQGIHHFRTATQGHHGPQQANNRRSHHFFLFITVSCRPDPISYISAPSHCSSAPSVPTDGPAP